MELPVISTILSSLAVLLSLVALFGRKGGAPAAPADHYSTRPLQLQAYERLVLLTERIALPNLIGRMNQPGMSAREMQALLVESIKQEFEYNATQQIYVSAGAWEAVRSLRDQNLLTINQVGRSLAPDARGADLNKQLLEVMLSQQQADLHTVVLSQLNGEARKLMA